MKTVPASRFRAAVFGLVVTILSVLATPEGGLGTVSRFRRSTSTRSKGKGFNADDTPPPSPIPTLTSAPNVTPVDSLFPSERPTPQDPTTSTPPSETSTKPPSPKPSTTSAPNFPSNRPSQDPATTPLVVPSSTCTCNDIPGGVAIGFVGLVGEIEGEGLIKDEALEDTILQLAKKVLQPKGRRLESETKMNNITVNNVTVSSRFQIVCPDIDQENCFALQFDVDLEEANTTDKEDFKKELVKAVGNMISVGDQTVKVLQATDGETEDQSDDDLLTGSAKAAVAASGVAGFFAMLLGYFKFFDPIRGLYLFSCVRQLYHRYWRKDTLTTVTNISDVTMELIICEDTQDITNTRVSSLSFKILNKILPNDVGVSQVFGTEETCTTGRRLQHFSIPKGQSKVVFVRADYHTVEAAYTGKDKYEGKFSRAGETRGYIIFKTSLRMKGGDFDIDAPTKEEIDFVPIARWEDWKEKFRGDDGSDETRRSLTERTIEEVPNEDEGGLDPHFFINASASDDVRNVLKYFEFVNVFYRAWIFWRAGYSNAITNNSEKELELIVRENKTQVTTFDKSSFSYGFPAFIFGEGGTEMEFGHQQTYTTGRKVQWMHLMPGQTKSISVRTDYEIALASYKKPYEGETFNTEEGFYVHEIKQLPWSEKCHVIAPESASSKVHFVKLGQWREFVRTMRKSSAPDNECWMPDEARPSMARHLSMPSPNSTPPPRSPPLLRFDSCLVSLSSEDIVEGTGNTVIDIGLQLQHLYRKGNAGFVSQDKLLFSISEETLLKREPTEMQQWITSVLNATRRAAQAKNEAELTIIESIE